MPEFESKARPVIPVPASRAGVQVAPPSAVPVNAVPPAPRRKRLLVCLGHRKGRDGHVSRPLLDLPQVFPPSPLLKTPSPSVPVHRGRGGRIDGQRENGPARLGKPAPPEALSVGALEESALAARVERRRNLRIHGDRMDVEGGEIENISAAGAAPPLVIFQTPSPSVATKSLPAVRIYHQRAHVLVSEDRWRPGRSPVGALEEASVRAPA